MYLSGDFSASHIAHYSYESFLILGQLAKLFKTQMTSKNSASLHAKLSEKRFLHKVFRSRNMKIRLTESA